MGMEKRPSFIHCHGSYGSHTCYKIQPVRSQCACDMWGTTHEVLDALRKRDYGKARWESYLYFIFIFAVHCSSVVTFLAQQRCTWRFFRAQNPTVTQLYQSCTLQSGHPHDCKDSRCHYTTCVGIILGNFTPTLPRDWGGVRVGGLQQRF